MINALAGFCIIVTGFAGMLYVICLMMIPNFSNHLNSFFKLPSFLKKKKHEYRALRYDSPVKIVVCNTSKQDVDFVLFQTNREDSYPVHAYGKTLVIMANNEVIQYHDLVDLLKKQYIVFKTISFSADKIDHHCVARIVNTKPNRPILHDEFNYSLSSIQERLFTLGRNLKMVINVDRSSELSITLWPADLSNQL